MLAMLTAGMILTLAMLLTLARLDIRKFLGYAAIVDVLFTALMLEMFAGTFMGVVAGAFAGLCMTGMLYVLKYTMGCKKIKFFRRGLVVGVHWVVYPGKMKEHIHV